MVHDVAPSLWHAVACPHWLQRPRICACSATNSDGPATWLEPKPCGVPPRTQRHITYGYQTLDFVWELRWPPGLPWFEPSRPTADRERARAAASHLDASVCGRFSPLARAASACCLPIAPATSDAQICTCCSTCSRQPMGEGGARGWSWAAMSVGGEWWGRLVGGRRGVIAV